MSKFNTAPVIHFKSKSAHSVMSSIYFHQQSIVLCHFIFTHAIIVIIYEEAFDGHSETTILLNFHHELEKVLDKKDTSCYPSVVIYTVKLFDKD
jgi:hypothetical protein